MDNLIYFNFKIRKLYFYFSIKLKCLEKGSGEMVYCLYTPPLWL